MAGNISFTYTVEVMGKNGGKNISYTYTVEVLGKKGGKYQLYLHCRSNGYEWWEISALPTL